MHTVTIAPTRRKIATSQLISVRTPTPDRDYERTIAALAERWIEREDAQQRRESNSSSLSDLSRQGQIN